MKIIFFFCEFTTFKKVIETNLPSSDWKVMADKNVCHVFDVFKYTYQYNIRKIKFTFPFFSRGNKKMKMKSFLWCLEPFPRKNFVRVLFLNRVKIVLRTNEYICAKNIFYNLCHKTRRQKKDGISCIFQLPLVIFT